MRRFKFISRDLMPIVAVADCRKSFRWQGFRAQALGIMETSIELGSMIQTRVKLVSKDMFTLFDAIYSPHEDYLERNRNIVRTLRE